MSHETRIIDVKVDRTGLVSVQTGDSHSTRYPVVGLWTNVLDFEDAVLTSRQISGIPTYEITDIASAHGEGAQTLVDISFAVSDEDDVDNDLTRSTVFVMRIPIQYLTVMQIMRNTDHTCYLAIFDDRHVMVAPEERVLPSHILIGLTMPPLETAESDDLAEKLSTMIAPEYTEPFIPVNEMVDDVEYTEKALRTHRKAQSHLLSILSGLSQGDKASFERLVQMETWFNNYFEKFGPGSIDEEFGLGSIDEEIATDHDMFIDSMVKLVHMAVIKSNIIADQETLREIDKKNAVKISPLGEQDVDQEFVNLMTQTDLEQTMRKISFDSHKKGTEVLRINAQISSIQTPFADGWPSSMSNIETLISDSEEFSNRSKLWESSVFSNLDDSEEFINQQVYSEVITSSILVVAARAVRHIETMRNDLQIEDTLKVHGSLKFVEWLNIYGDSYSWEILAAHPLLASYETSQFADLLATVMSYDNNLDQALYLKVVLHMVTHQLQNEEWTVDSFQQSFDQLGLHFPNVRQVASYLLSELAENAHLDTEENEDSPCVPGIVVNNIVHAGFDIEVLAGATSTLIPVMADLQAERNNLDVGEEEWIKFRSQYIKDLLTAASQSFMRNFSGSDD